MQNTTNNYLFSVKPGIHSQDPEFAFYHDAPIDSSGVLFPLSSGPDIAVARLLQTWIASFVTHGTPTAPGTPAFEPYGSEGNLLILGERNNSTDVVRSVDPAIVPGRCNSLAQAIQDQTLVEVD